MLLTDLTSARRLHGVSASPRDPKISHLFFADDTLLFGVATEEEARRFQWALSLYEDVSGQRINIDKSGVLFSPNTAPRVRLIICGILSILEVESHGKYLGLPTVIGRKNGEIFQSLKDRIRLENSQMEQAEPI